jgi:hypothetical protein
VLTVTGIGAETGFLDLSLEQAEEKITKSSNPNTTIKRG